jgi:tRNA-2-methylthio-N6-dimethylallyladenosine synthase
MMARKIFIKTFGCQMNVYDSNRIRDLVAPLGFQPTQDQADADLVVFNTCHIREKAAEKLYSDLGRAKPFKEERLAQGQVQMIAVAGCTAQAEGEEVFRRAPYVDMVVGPQAYHELPILIAQALRTQEAAAQKTEEGMPRQRLLNLDFPEHPKFDHLPAVDHHEGVSAFVTIQEGCDKFCHFCCVPYTRGAEYSRPVQAIEEEVKRLLDKGVKEITLLGQNVNAYHGQSPKGQGEWTLGQLIHHLARLEGLDFLYYMTSHPRDVDQSLLEAHRDISKLAPFLHLPVQSGSDRVLKAMNRKHDRAFYLNLIDQFRTMRPDIAFSSDFIVGYPGETDQDFEDTLDLVRAVNYAQAYSFKYSKRPGTPAWALDNQVDEDIKTHRLDQLQDLLREQQKAFNHNMIGQEMDILLLRKGRKEGQLIGKTLYMQSVHVKVPEHRLGRRARVKIQSASSNSLTGVLVTGDNKEKVC